MGLPACRDLDLEKISDKCEGLYTGGNPDPQRNTMQRLEDEVRQMQSEVKHKLLTVGATKYRNRGLDRRPVV